MRWLIMLVLCCGVAHAEDRHKARAAYNTATQHYDLGEYKQALEAFKEAYRNFEDPAILFNLGQCHRQVGDYQAAVRAYKTYLMKLPDAPNREEVREVIFKLEKAIAETQAAKTSPPEGMSPAIEKTDEKPARVVAPPIAGPAPPPPQTPVYKKWWLWTAVVAVVVAGAAVGLGVGLSQTPSAPKAGTDFGTFRF